jgi:hypothetical protein
MMQNLSKMSIGFLGEQSKLLNVSKPIDLIQLERKILADDNDNFDQDMSKSDLNLSQSHNNGNAHLNPK